MEHKRIIARVVDLNPGDCFEMREPEMIVHGASLPYLPFYECEVRPGRRFGKRYANQPIAKALAATGTYVCVYYKVRGPKTVDLMVINQDGAPRFIVGCNPTTLVKRYEPANE